MGRYSTTGNIATGRRCASKDAAQLEQPHIPTDIRSQRVGDVTSTSVGSG